MRPHIPSAIRIRARPSFREVLLRLTIMREWRVRQSRFTRVDVQSTLLHATRMWKEYT
jgi:hypothetical protein